MWLPIVLRGRDFWEPSPSERRSTQPRASKRGPALLIHSRGPIRVSTKVGILEKHQDWDKTPERHLSRKRAILFLAEDIAEPHPTDKNVIRLKIRLRAGQSDPLRCLIAKYATLDRGDLLPWLRWYFPFTSFPRDYRQHKSVA